MMDIGFIHQCQLQEISHTMLSSVAETDFSIMKQKQV